MVSHMVQQKLRRLLEKEDWRRISSPLMIALLVSGFALLPAGLAAQSVCQDCHGDKSLIGIDSLGKEASMFVDDSLFAKSVHSALTCVDCHTDLQGVDGFPHAEKLQRVNCSTCHDDVQKIYASSAHGQAAENPNAPSCSDCHGKHNIFPASNPDATVSAKNLPYTCASCHHKIELKADPDVRITDSFDRYMRGIHAIGIHRGIASAASCNDCHGTHDLYKASDLRSKVHKMNIPSTCSKCHNDINIQYQRGIHGKALAAGILDAPNCTDCHGEHEILKIDDPSSPVNASNLSDFVCGKCHNDPRIVEKYGLSEGRFTSYQDSYHGLAIRGGSIKAASCISCHEAHAVLPKSNPLSSISPDNIVHTCQQCHPRASFAFASSYSHNVASYAYHSADNWVRWIYILAIVLIIGAMVGHNGIVLGRYIRDKHRENRLEKTVQRFTGNMVFQHMVLTVAFIVLVITGFALKYPDAWWVSILNFFGIYEDARSVVHRIAAVLLIYTTIHHTVFLLFTRRGKSELKAMWPTKQDLRDAIMNIRYHLGLGKAKPKFDRYDYTEKGEYWALVWGTFAMMLTGFILWFPTFFTSFMPAWVVKIAETIHLYEAWLATLAIFVFHFFYVIFHPEQYPMSLTWITGRMTEKECQIHHPIWYEKISHPEGLGAETNAKAVEDSKKEA